MNKTLLIGICFSLAAAVALFYFALSPDRGPGAAAKSVLTEDNRQIIEIAAKGGYFPALTLARAEMPAILRVSTSGTYDCSSALVIPALGFRQFLAATGVVEVEIPPQPPGTKISGVCTMGMYGFEIRFE